MSNPVKVLQIFGSLNVGGAETRMMDIYRNIDRTKVQFEFLSLDTSDEQYYERDIEDLGGRIYKVDNPRKSGIFKHYKTIFKIMSKENYVAVHAHTSYHMGIVMMAAFQSKINIRISHARTSGVQKATLSTKVFHLVGKAFINIFATHLLSVSREASKYLFGKNPLKEVHVLPNSINHSLFKTNFDDNNLGDKIGVDRRKINIIQIGRFEKVKNHKFTIKIIDDLTKKNVNIHLYLVGGGLLEKEIVDEIEARDLSDHVTFLGIRKDVNKILKYMDYLVLPSLFEGLPGVILEAQASGIKSLVSDRVTQDCDLGLGIVNFISLHDEKSWIRELERKSEIQVSNKRIDEIFLKSGFNISHATNYLTKIYCSNE
ncbi:MAG TPA: glycosyltransferase family 1 protein [Gallicola sp.]|nr:glycosyltransferase family 1 protein [Gallicola sp.]